jgi:hypothetical protein
MHLTPMPPIYRVVERSRCAAEKKFKSVYNS